LDRTHSSAKKIFLKIKKEEIEKKNRGRKIRRRSPNSLTFNFGKSNQTIGIQEVLSF